MLTPTSKLTRKPTRPALALCCACACLAANPASAQATAAQLPVDSAPAAAQAASAPAPAPAASQAKGAPSAPGARVIEDDNVRIEEVRIRGQLQRVTVHNKVGGGSYEIIVGNGGRDTSQPRGAAGQRAWSLFSF